MCLIFRILNEVCSDVFFCVIHIADELVKSDLPLFERSVVARRDKTRVCQPPKASNRAHSVRHRDVDFAVGEIVDQNLLVNVA